MNSEYEPTVVLAHSPRSWMQRVHFFIVDHGGALVGGYALSAEEALAGGADVLVVDDTCSFLTHRLIVELHQAGTAVVGVYDRSQGVAGEERLKSLDVDEILSADAETEDFLVAIRRLGAVPGKTGVRDTRPAQHPIPGRLIAVAGASGGLGATEVALALALRLHSRRRAAALIEADELTPSLAQRLGMPPHPNLSTAVEAIVHGSGPWETSVSRHSSGIGVVCGRPLGSGRHAPRADDVLAVIRALCAGFGIVVANVSSDAALPARRADTGVAQVSHAVLSHADEIVLVGAASPVGLSRVAAWVAAMPAPVAAKDLHLILNRFPGGGYRSRELVGELMRLCTPASVSVVPSDRRVRRAEWCGTPVAGGPFRRAIARTAAALEKAEATL